MPRRYSRQRSERNTADDNLSARRSSGQSGTAELRAEAAFAARLPNHSTACQTRLSQFFTQWFDTAYHGAKPQITGPGLHGHPFYADGRKAPSRS